MGVDVPFFDFGLAPRKLRRSWKKSIYEVLETNQYIRGQHVNKFEQDWADSIGIKHAIGVGNGLDGLVLALKALGIGKGNTVAVPSHTFIATWNAVHLTGATPVGVDVDSSGLLDLNLLDNLDVRIDAVIPVHMHGMCVNMDQLTTWARNKGVRLIEDASQAHFAKIGEKFVGTFGDVGVFSLYPSKNLGALGDAGVVVTNSDEIAELVRQDSNYGSAVGNKYLHQSIGTNSRLDTIQASILSKNLERLDESNKHRRRLAKLYIDGINENANVKIVHKDSATSVWHHFTVLAKSREKMIQHLKSQGIQTEVHYPNLAAHEYESLTGQILNVYPNGEKIANQILSLPISQWHTSKQITNVIKAINNYE
jgi:dTDP-4-amino-4,6-dideoxygalactose transaminase